MPDDLPREIDEIGAEASELSLTIVSGSFNENNLPTVVWETSSPSALKGYLAAARKLQSKLVVLEQFEFNQEALEQLGPEQSEEDGSEEPEDDEQTERANKLESKWQEIVREHAGYYGSLYSFALYFFSEGICYRYDKEADWYVKLTEAANSLKEEMEAAEAELEEEEIPDLTDKEVEEIAIDLAKSELFQQAGNQNARRFALKKKFPELIEEHYRQTSEIIDQAKGIFELEIKPEMEKALDEQIAELAKTGMSKDQIAKKMKVPISRVKRVL
jgi:hypothetical protein